MVAHIAKHSTGAILSQQQHDLPNQSSSSSVSSNQLQHEYLAQLSQKPDFMAQNAQMAQNIQNFHNQMQRQMQQTLGQMSQQQTPPAKEIKLESPRCATDIGVQSMPNIKREPVEIKREDAGNSVQEATENNQRMPQPSMPGNVQHSPAPGPPSFELDFSHGFHFASPAVMAAMNQQIALMNQALPPFLQHGGMYTGGPGLMFAPGLPPTNFLPPTRDENPLASLAANLNLNKRSLSPPDSNSPEAKKQRLHHSMRMLKDEPVPEGYVRFVLVIIILSYYSITVHFQTLFHLFSIGSDSTKIAGTLTAVTGNIKPISIACAKTVVIRFATRHVSFSIRQGTSVWTLLWAVIFNSIEPTCHVAVHSVHIRRPLVRCKTKHRTSIVSSATSFVQTRTR